MQLVDKMRNYLVGSSRHSCINDNMNSRRQHEHRLMNVAMLDERLSTAPHRILANTPFYIRDRKYRKERVGLRRPAPRTDNICRPSYKQFQVNANRMVNILRLSFLRYRDLDIRFRNSIASYSFHVKCRKSR